MWAFRRLLEAVEKFTATLTEADAMVRSGLKLDTPDPDAIPTTMDELPEPRKRK